MSKNMFDNTPRKTFSENKDKIERELIEEKDSPFKVKKAPSKDRISLTIDDNINEFLTSMSGITGLSKSETVNIILKDYIKNNSHVREIIEKDDSLKIIFAEIN